MGSFNASLAGCGVLYVHVERHYFSVSMELLLSVTAFYIILWCVGSFCLWEFFVFFGGVFGHLCFEGGWLGFVFRVGVY